MTMIEELKKYLNSDMSIDNIKQYNEKTKFTFHYKDLSKEKCEIVNTCTPGYKEQVCKQAIIEVKGDYQMNKIKEIENKENIEYGTIDRAYRKTLKSGNDMLNFFDNIWDEDISEICNFFKRNDINEFTISCQSANTIPLLHELEQKGFKITGTKMINTYYESSSQIPAIILKSIQ